MSWDTCISIDTGGDEMALVEDVGNYTYNVAPMYYGAFGEGGFRQLNKMNCKDATPILKKAIKNMMVNKQEYTKMNPPNGWGNYEGALEYLKKILQACKNHPNAVIDIQ